MLPRISLAGIGTYTIVIEALLQMIGVDAPAGSVGHAIEGVAAIGGLLLLVIGQLRRGDLRFGLLRK